ncbi:MAG: type VI secretion system baseplate subunit TssF [Deltaproteobacteria bacterium]|jgi:type VI secretion system protein ImpG|nr:type VI secretion system baseplate subunit TssF [Deltaproteobacteria bacterium]
MLTELYRRELNSLLAQAAEFGQAHPALAPWLAAKGQDPDVERLLEGTAFLAATVRRQLAEGFPELAEALLDLLFPRLGQALPAMILTHFQPAPGFSEAQTAPRGAQLASVPVNSVRARFALASQTPIWPAQISQARLSQTVGGEGVLELKAASAAPLKNWLPDSLEIHLAGEYGQACDRRELLLAKTKAIEVAAGNASYVLSPSAVAPSGLAPAFEGEAGPYLGYGLIREYFAFPEKFLFARLSGLGPLKNLSETTFSVRFYLKNLPKSPPPVKADHFLLNVGPAINLLTRPAHPINVDHRREEYLIRPQRGEAEKLAIQRVRQVVGVSASGRERPYLPFAGYGGQSQAGYYAVRRGEGPGANEGHYLKVVYPQGRRPPEPETLSIDLYCYNRELTDFLRPGDVSLPTEKSPAMAVFANLSTPSRVCPPPAAEGTLWRILSCLHLSLSPLASAEGLRDLLALYAPLGDPDPARKIGVRQKIDSILALSAETADAFVRGWPVRGVKLTLTVDGANFASPGEIGLFGDVLERFLADFLSLNSFLRLTVVEKNAQEARSWPIRIGSKKIL